jgi:hypothetical protein
MYSVKIVEINTGGDMSLKKVSLTINGVKKQFSVDEN